MTLDSFLRLTARLLIGQLTLADVDEFLHDLQVVQQIFGDFCLTEATCVELLRRSGDLLEERASKFSCGSKDPGKAIEELREGVMIDGDLQLAGRSSKSKHLERERECITNSLVSAATGPASDEPLGGADVGTLGARDRAQADLDRDGQVTNVEWAFFLAGLAAQQGFSGLQGRALAAAESGLGKVLADGTAKCDESLSDGKALLERGRKIADAAQLLAHRVRGCDRKLRAACFCLAIPRRRSRSETQAFSARPNEGHTDFDWTASDGTIDSAGLFTAPTKPGPVTVTATVRRILQGKRRSDGRSAPPDRSSSQGECRTIAVTVTPAERTRRAGRRQAVDGNRPEHRQPGGHLDRQRWQHQPGRPPSQRPSSPAAITITATSKQDTTKTGTTTVTVAHPGVNVTVRNSQLSPL